MITSRRSLLLGMAGILTASAAPAIIRSGILMPIKQPIYVPVILPIYSSFEFPTDHSVLSRKR